MVASRETVQRILDVLLIHLKPELVQAILHDLKQVKGNTSFRRTIERLQHGLDLAVRRKGDT